MRAHHAAARGPRRRAKDVEVARQLRRASPSRRGSSSASSCRCPTSSCPGTSRSPPAGTPTAIDEVTGALADGSLKPVDAKRLLARTVVDLYHGDGAGDGGRGRVRPGVPGPRGARPRSPSVVDRRPPSCATAGSAWPGCSRWRSRTRCRRTRRAAARSSRAACASTARSSTDPELEVTPADVDGKILQMGKRNWARLRA